MTVGHQGRAHDQEGGFHDVSGEGLEAGEGGGCLALFGGGEIEPSASAGGSVALEVEDLDAFNAELKGKGVEYKAEMIQSPVCRMSIILDSEGNSIILHELKKK